MLRVIDRFTTQFGSWDSSQGERFTISKEAIQRYGNEMIPGAGADHHIFVYVPAGNDVVEFNTADGRNPTSYPVFREGGWINHPIFGDSYYDPDKGEVGPWLVRIDGEKVAEGIGLPFGWHVSTFIVVEDGPGVALPTGPSVPVAGKDHIEVVVNGVIVWSN